MAIAKVTSSNLNKNYLEKFFLQASIDDLFHINIYYLAKQWQVAKKELLHAFVAAVAKKTFILEWQIHCPHCGQLVKEVSCLQEITSKNFCKSCQLSFNNCIDTNIEVFFSVHPQKKKLPTSFKEKYLRENQQAKFCSWQNQHTIYGIDIIQSPVFYQLLSKSKDFLLPQQDLHLAHNNILFVSIKNFTQLYSNCGDSQTFQMLKKYLASLEKVICRNDGIVVKTMGDVLMAAFSKTEHALEAALEAQVTLLLFYKNKTDQEKIEARMGLSSGEMLLATANNQLDYFGKTVNIANQIHSLARKNSVVFSQEIFSLPSSKRIIKKYSRQVHRSHVKLKGVVGEQILYQVSFDATKHLADNSLENLDL